ncbi:MAG: RNA polymerase sigma factor [Oscillospiraceae bacterium]
MTSAWTTFAFDRKSFRRKTPCSTDPDPAASLEDMAAVSVSVKAALEKLPAAQREAVILHYFHQFTASEIARVTNTPLPTVKSRLRAARSTLSDDLREDFE